MFSLPPMPALSMRSVQVRILALFVLVIVALQVGVFVLINTLGAAAVRKNVGAEVVAGVRVFERLLELDTQRLIEGMRVLTADPAFRELVVAGDRNALAPVLAKQAKRSNAAVTLLVNVDHRVVAGTLEAEIGRRISFSKLLDRAAAAQQAAGFATIGGQLFQLVVVPVPAPQPLAWVVSGYRITDALRAGTAQSDAPGGFVSRPARARGPGGSMAARCRSRSAGRSRATSPTIATPPSTATAIRNSATRRSPAC